MIFFLVGTVSPPVDGRPLSTSPGRSKVCAATARIGALRVDLPEDQILDVPDGEFAAASLSGAAESVRTRRSCPTSATHRREISSLRSALSQSLLSAAAELKAATSRTVNIYSLTNHTQDANLDTVTQLVHREKVDACKAIVTDGNTPLTSLTSS